MPAGMIIRFRPSGPWRFGPSTGERSRTDLTGPSDLLYAAVGEALRWLGEGSLWREAVREAPDPAFRLSSLFLYSGRSLFVPPPASLWPPPASNRLRWRAAQYVPVHLVSELLQQRPLLEERWEIDLRSQCLIAAGTAPPVRVAVRRRAAVDRIAPGSIAPHATACLEFAPNAGVWAVAAFRSASDQEQWEPLLRAAFRLLADEGLGGERRLGWGRAEAVEFQSGPFPKLLSGVFPEEEAGAGYWLLSLFYPAASDEVDWEAGSYALTERGSPGSERVRMAAPGSVLRASRPPRGQWVRLARMEVEPAVRAGFALAVPLPAPSLEEAAA